MVGGYLFFKFDDLFKDLAGIGAILKCTELRVHPNWVAVRATRADTPVLVNKRRSVIWQIDSYLA